MTPPYLENNYISSRTKKFLEQEVSKKSDILKRQNNFLVGESKSPSIKNFGKF